MTNLKILMARSNALLIVSYKLYPSNQVKARMALASELQDTL